MNLKMLIRNIIISFIAAFLIFFVLLIFSPILPINLLQGNELLIYILICIIAFIVSLFLPSENTETSLN